MSREQERIRRKLEDNPVVECNKIRNRYCPDLFHDFADIENQRNLSYTEYSNDELLGNVFYKGIAGIESMQMMTYEFNREKVVENLYRFMGKTKAFKRLAGKIKKVYPRLPIILLADSLYAAEPVMDICRENGWEYIIRCKNGSIPSITEEYEKIPEKETAGHAEFINDIDYNGKPVNMLRFWDEKIVNGESVRTDFQWLTSIRLTKKECREYSGHRQETMENRE